MLYGYTVRVCCTGHTVWEHESSTKFMKSIRISLGGEREGEKDQFMLFNEITKLKGSKLKTVLP